jgi:hypothetical protein
VLHAPDGVVSLWEPDVTLRWRFRQASLDVFQNPGAVAARVEELLSKALLAWGEAVPVRFSRQEDNTDFEIVVRSNDDCDINGCVLASAFFPDSGRHQLVVYPQMFGQSEDEQIETMCHELGHVFGLRHFFAQVTESDIPSELFGVHEKFTVMNYGPNSMLTDNDRADLIRLYDEVWSGDRVDVNGTPIQLVKPFSAIANLISTPFPAPVSPLLALAGSQPAQTPYRPKGPRRRLTSMYSALRGVR